MRQTRTSIDTTSEHTLNDDWNDEREVLFSDAWIGTARVQILRIKRTKVTQTTKLATIWPDKMAQGIKEETKTQEEIAARDEESTRLQEAHRKRGILDVSPEDTECLKETSEARGKPRKMRSSPNAVYSQGK